MREGNFDVEAGGDEGLVFFFKIFQKSKS